MFKTIYTILTAPKPILDFILAVIDFLKISISVSKQILDNDKQYQELKKELIRLFEVALNNAINTSTGGIKANAQGFLTPWGTWVTSYQKWVQAWNQWVRICKQNRWC